MWVLNADEMREADRRTIEDAGVPASVLMENAGLAVVERLTEVLSQRPDLRLRKIAVVCGKGNNGGDGLVVARLLVESGHDVQAFVLSPIAALTGDRKEKLERARARSVRLHEVVDEDAWKGAFLDVRGAGVVVDAILGTGLKRAAESLAAVAINDLNALDAYRVAVDVPSGLSAASGRVDGPAVRADLTVALAAPKVCHFVPPACLHVGRLEIADIGISAETIAACAGLLATIEPEPLVGLLPPRRADANKGDFGHLLLVAGSIGKTGAAAMAALSALRSGVGLVTVACPQSTLASIAGFAPEIMTVPLAETPDGGLAASTVEQLRELSKGKTALAIGPGLGRNSETEVLVRRLVGLVSLPVAIDADGINAFAKDRRALPRGRPVALTPHPGEMARLLGISSAEVQEDRLGVARRFATENEVFIALKGFRTLVAEPTGHVRIATTGNPGMATGGTGDVLTGIVGALLAQGVSPGPALQLGVYLHGLAGDLAAHETGQTALIATDVLRKIPAALRLLGVP